MNAYALALEIDAISSTSVAEARAQVADAASDAAATRDRLLFFVVVLVSLTAVFTTRLLTSVVRPIRILTRRAASVARGEQEAEPVPIGGRDELTELGTVLDSVAEGLRHLQHQVEAIADGHLDDPSLDIAVPGPVGAYVQARVEDLRTASGTLRARAGTDALTGLLNRRGLIETLEEDGRYGSDGPGRLVIYIDLDRFKAVNDEHGHKHGDAVLQAVAQRLRALVRPGDVVCRLGGDEFVLIVQLNPALITAFIDRIAAQVAAPVEVEGVSHRVGCSIGVSTLADSADVGHALDVALDRADRRMLDAKTQRRDELLDTVDTTR
jgi:diguanylate cyclase (GGDEF)-like protein